MESWHDGFGTSNVMRFDGPFKGGGYVWQLTKKARNVSFYLTASRVLCAEQCLRNISYQLYRERRMMRKIDLCETSRKVEFVSVLRIIADDARPLYSFIITLVPSAAMMEKEL
jgi:hypothetical protein